METQNHTPDDSHDPAEVLARRIASTARISRDRIAELLEAQGDTHSA